MVSITEAQSAALRAAWPTEHASAAAQEGWCLCTCPGSSNGPFQVEAIDDVFDPAWLELAGFIPPRLEDGDDEAATIVANGTKPHHAAVRQFLAEHNPQEMDYINSFKES